MGTHKIEDEKEMKKKCKWGEKEKAEEQKIGKIHVKWKREKKDWMTLKFNALQSLISWFLALKEFCFLNFLVNLPQLEHEIYGDTAKEFLFGMLKIF